MLLKYKSLKISNTRRFSYCNYFIARMDSDFLYSHRLNYDEYSLKHSMNSIEKIERVEDRDLIESLFPYLKSISIRCRYLIAFP